MNCFRFTVLCSLTIVGLFALQLWFKQPRFTRCPKWFASCRETSSPLLSSNGNKLFTKYSREQQARMHLPQHPLDPLTFSEILQIQALILHRANPNPNGTNTITNPNSKWSSRRNPLGKNPKNGPPYLHSVVLEEPDKEDVLAWQEGHPLLPRKAAVTLMMDGAMHQIVINLNSNGIEKEETYHGTGKPILTFEDMNLATSLPVGYGKFLESLKSRNLKKEEVVCLPISIGWYGTKEDEGGKRLIKVQCYYGEDTSNYYMRPIEGITIVVDLDVKKVRDPFLLSIHSISSIHILIFVSSS